MLDSSSVADLVLVLVLSSERDEQGAGESVTYIEVVPSWDSSSQLRHQASTLRFYSLANAASLQPIAAVPLQAWCGKSIEKHVPR